VIEDIFDVRSPLTGIHAGLVRMDSDFAFVTSCDTPLLTEDVIRMLLDRIEPDVDVIAPAQGTHYQPMCAIYARRCASEIETMLRSGALKVDLLFKRVRLKTVAYEELRAVDPQLRSFFNVNTPEDLQTARRMCAGPRFDFPP
jgi:molybdopterin-guanine dinucleotide biosynthesis protein A